MESFEMKPPRERSTDPPLVTPRRRGQADIPPTIPKSYTLPFPVILELRRAAKEYGSQGRALQVGSELAIRLRKLPSVGKPDREMLMRMTYKLPPRTVQLIEEIARTQYDGDAGQAIAACVKLLKVKKFD
jgi:hypothetical protein